MLTIEMIVAMAVAAMAEENHVDVNHVVVRSFRELQKTSLQRYIEDNHITYQKYQLEGMEL